jgi:hypothetical protein
LIFSFLFFSFVLRLFDPILRCRFHNITFSFLLFGCVFAHVSILHISEPLPCLRISFLISFFHFLMCRLVCDARRCWNDFSQQSE